MSSKFKFPSTSVESVIKRVRGLGRGMTRDEANETGRRVVSKMKELISRGISPVRGPGIGSRFERYKNPDRYPGKKKPHSPVNLKLSGDFLGDLGYAVVPRADGFGAEVGYGSSKSAVKEQGHREGANGQPSRPTIPDATRGEGFARSVEDEYSKVILGAVRKR